MALADLVTQLLPKRWKDKFDGADESQGARLEPTFPVGRPALGNDLPEQGGYSGQMQRPDRPFIDAQVRPTLPQADTSIPPVTPESGGAISPTINLPPLSEGEMSLPANRIKVSTEDMHPVRNRTIDDPATRESDYQSQLSQYRPQKEGTGKTILRSALGLFGGGIPGAISPWVDRTRPDRNWRDRELAQSEDREQQGLSNRLLQARVKDAETPDVVKPTYDWFPQDSDGDGIPDTEVYKPVTEGAQRSVFVKPTLGRQPIFKTRKNADGSEDTLQSDDGKKWEVVPDLQSAPPLEKPEKSPVDYPQRASWYYKKQSESETEARRLRDEASKIVAQPGYELAADKKAEKEDLLRRATKAEDDAHGYRDKGDEAKTQVAPTRTGRTAPTTHGFSVSGWLSRNPGKTEADAKAFHDSNARYQSYPLVP